MGGEETNTGDTYWTCHESPDGLFCERVFIGVKGEGEREEGEVKRRVGSGKTKERWEKRERGEKRHERVERPSAHIREKKKWTKSPKRGGWWRAHTCREPRGLMCSAAHFGGRRGQGRRQPSASSHPSGFSSLLGMLVFLPTFGTHVGIILCDGLPLMPPLALALRCSSE